MFSLIESAKIGELSLDPVARWEALKKAEGIILDDAAIFPVYQKGAARMIRSGVTGVEYHAVGHPGYKNAEKK